MNGNNGNRVEASTEMITLKVKANDQEEVHFKIARNMELKKMFDRYNAKLGIQPNMANFIYEGQKISPN